MIDVRGTEQQLILAASSLVGCTFRERVEAAAAAGFDAIGLSLGDYRSIIETEMKPQQMRSLLAANGVRLAEVEAIIGFAADDAATQGVLGPDLSYTSPDDLRDFWTIAELFEPRHVQVAGSFHTNELEPDAGERFADLCDAAARVGLILCIEFLAPSNVPDLATALRVVEEADRPNGAITIDTWHLVRGNPDIELLRALPASRIGLIQINDGSAEPADPDYIAETVHLRRPPGEGDFDVAGLLDAMLGTGARMPISVEVMSDELNALSPAQAARRMAEAARRVLAAVDTDEG